MISVIMALKSVTMALTASTILSESVVVLKVTEFFALPVLSTAGLPSASVAPSKTSFMVMVSPSIFTLLELRVISLVSPLTVMVNFAS